jgi:hypothetical protein
MKHALALVPLLACNASPPPPPVATATSSLAPISDGRGGWYAVLTPVALQDELGSNLGGHHLTLRVVERRPDTPHLIHAGGHGKYLSMHCDDRFVAHIIKPATPIKIFYSEELARAWIEGGLPSYDGEIIAVARVAPGEDLTARLAGAAREGLPGSPGAAASSDHPSCGGCEERDDDAVFGAKQEFWPTTGDLSCPLSA